jgi:uncharacterized phage protein (TIGR01671 family)
MQKIKFRAWNKEKKEFDYIDFSFGGEVYCNTDNLPLQQYTGAKDKNGKEIYEGDIIASFATNDNELTEVHRGVVEYNNSAFCFYINGQSIHSIFDCYGMLQIGIDKKEIIGNVYENEELLTNK